MKNLFFLLIVVCGFNFDLNAQAENYQSFEWDLVRFGYAIPAGSQLGSGVALGTEPKYNLKDNISIGLRAEFALFSSDQDLGAFGSYALIGDYYFNTTQAKRAFAGLGIGTFSGGSVEVNGQSVDTGVGSSIGLVPRVGYELGLLRLSAEYNLLFKEGFNNYIGIHAGINLFGKYKG